MKKEKLKEISKKTEDKLVEYMNCKNDFIYFCSKYVKIELPGEDRILNPYEPQKKLIKLITDEKFVLVLKSRQIGISTIIQAYIVWLIIFYENVIVGIISKDASEATDFARKTRAMVDKIPMWLRPKYDKYTEQSFILKNGSKVFASPVNPNAPEKTLRGKAITFLVIDEAAFVKYIDEAWTSMVPALSTNQMHAKQGNVPFGTVVLSTPNKTVGVGKWFYERYSNAVSGGDIFKDFVIHWSDVKELSDDPSWYETQCKLFDNDKRKIEQELELKFLSTSGSFFDEDTMQKLQTKRPDPIEKLKLFNGEAWRFAHPIPGKYYIIGVDTAPQHGEDKSAITVWDYETLEQMFEYQGKLQVRDFINVVKLAATQYHGLLVIESNSYGNQVVEELNNSEFSTMLYKEKRGVNTIVPGLSTNARTRPLMIDALYTYVTQYPECIKSKRLILELIGLVSKNSGKVEADTGCNDDLALSAALCFFVRKWDAPLMLESSGISNSMVEDLAGVIGFNTDISLTEVTNSGIMHYVKEKSKEEDFDGLINTFSFFVKG